jgi:hypothetical protein
MKSLKKIIVLALVVMMTAAMTITAMADNGVNTNTATDKTKMDIPVTQSLFFKNADGSDVYEPNLYYTYTITPGREGATVIDHNGVSASVKAGDMRGFTGKTADTAENKAETFSFGINFSSDHAKVTASADGKAYITKKVVVSFDGSKLQTKVGVDDKGTADTADDEDVYAVTPGVYRYIITQTLSADDKNAVGVEEQGTPDKDVVLDITVNADGQVVGSVIHETVDPDDDNPSVDNGDEDGDGDPTNNPATDDEDEKGTGFGPTDPDDDFHPEDPKDTTEDDPTKPADDKKDPVDDEDNPLQTTTDTKTASDFPGFYDLYTTYDVTVTKDVTGGMGDKSNYWPFQLDITNSIPGAAFDYKITDNAGKNLDVTKKQLAAATTADATAGAKTLGSATATVADGLELKHGGKVTLIGVPSNLTAGSEVSVKANEYNNTADGYKVTATDFGIAADTALASGAATAASTAASFKNATAATTFTVTNKLESISPTGVVMKVAPFASMFAAGIILIAIVRRRKDEVEA